MPSLVESGLPREPSSKILAPAPHSGAPRPTHPQAQFQQYLPQQQFQRFQPQYAPPYQPPQRQSPPQQASSAQQPPPAHAHSVHAQPAPTGVPGQRPLYQNRPTGSGSSVLPPASDWQPAASAPGLRPGSPVPPEYSPITPKVQPVLPVQPAFIPPPDNGGAFTFSMDAAQQSTPPPAEAAVSPPRESKSISPKNDRHTPPTEPVKQPIPETVYIPQPPNLPFSADDATDAIALRAAISTLQFQKQRAQDDMRTLERIKQMALDDPDRFKTELAAGRLKEKRHVIGNMQAILGSLDDGDSDDEVVFETTRDGDSPASTEERSSARPAEVPDSQPSRPGSSDAAKRSMVDSFTSDEDRNGTHTPRFPPIPGAQSIVRMPYVNWDKYGIVGEPLESMHAQQQKWPGTSSGSGQARGPEYAVAAPYSPFTDRIDGPATATAPRTENRKDSAAVSPGGHAP